MTLFAKCITPASIDEITELNGGVRPTLVSNASLNDNTYFIYGGDSHANFTPVVLTKTEFRKQYRWLNVTTEDNIVVKK